MAISGAKIAPKWGVHNLAEAGFQSGTAKRWELLKAMCGAGPLTVREAAKRVNRDIKSVHTDLAALLSAGVLDRTASGQVEFPYEAVKVEFLLQAA